jgi:nicotinate-nucleotide adenylyltransferase
VALALPDWHRWEEVLQLASILVMYRPGWSLPDPLPPWWVAGDLASADDVTLYEAGWMTAIEVPAVDISAAMIRVALAGGKTIDRQVPVAIAQYIEEHELYE